jgi:hypothetical protein
MTMKTVSAIALTAMLCACAGRPPAQIGVVQPHDGAMDCLAIQAEVNANTARIADLGRESSNKVAQNVAAGVAGLVIWPLWFAMDFQGAADKDTVALQSRQNYLGTLANQRGCAMQAAPPAPQPARTEPKPQGATQ